MNEKQTPWGKASIHVDWLLHQQGVVVKGIEETIRQACEEHAAAITRERDEARAASAVMPGAWKCDKCGFIQQNNTLHVKDGTMSANVADECRPCPNDSGPLRALTWREANKTIYERCVAEIEANNRLRAALAICHADAHYVDLEWAQAQHPELAKVILNIREKSWEAISDFPTSTLVDEIVPLGEIKGLVDKWRDRIALAPTLSNRTAIQQCLDELEAVLKTK
jgi:hypothetical protein